MKHKSQVFLYKELHEISSTFAVILTCQGMSSSINCIAKMAEICLPSETALVRATYSQTDVI